LTSAFGMLSISRMLSVKVSSKQQISLPSEARRRLGIHPGDRLTVQVVDDTLVLRRRPERPSERMAGIGRHIWDGVDPVERIRRMRDEWDDQRGA
jgi:AbrB family looped-hinge helix DNA binding protein